MHKNGKKKRSKFCWFAAFRTAKNFLQFCLFCKTQKDKNAWEMKNFELIESGLQLKKQGNAAFKAGKLETAIELYRQVCFHFSCQKTHQKI